MLLTGGGFYRLQSGQVVKVQLEAGNLLSAYDVEGNRVHQCEADDHVNGWEPVGQVDWNKARDKYKKERAAVSKKAANKGKRVARSKETRKKEESNESENGKGE